jgi:sugar (pentulose or hexulose) kinase
MSAGKVAAIFDVGKTNKKLLLFDEQYQLLQETCIQLSETTDEDGFPSEDIHALTDWLITSFEGLSMTQGHRIAALNFSSYGASLVNLDKDGEPCTPLYNYLKPFPDSVKDQFYTRYGGEEAFARQTASPVLGNLNSGMQLYRLKYEQPGYFSKIKSSLHLPQYLSYVLSGKIATDITSVGCHTNLWDFRSGRYHEWVRQENIHTLFAPVSNGDALINDPSSTRQPPIGVGLHDSSAALIPYLQFFHEPFILISTGTWCISMNPFNADPLTDEELKSDCLCYLTYMGETVKSSRLFAGNDHEQQVKRLNEYFHKNVSAYIDVRYDPSIFHKLMAEPADRKSERQKIGRESAFANRSLDQFDNYEMAYHQLIADIMVQQVASTRLVMNKSRIADIFVDGGFSKNDVYMTLLALAFPDVAVSAATVPQSTGLGAALAIHKHWNDQPLPSELIKLRRY